MCDLVRVPSARLRSGVLGLAVLALVAASGPAVADVVPAAQAATQAARPAAAPAKVRVRTVKPGFSDFIREYESVEGSLVVAPSV